MKNIAILILNILLISVAAKAQTPSIDEGKFISIGGIEQWITIQGEDSTKPAILFLHRGPGSVMSPYKTFFGDLNKDFVLVNWDQRGAGRTFGHLAPTQVDEAFWKAHPLTLEQMTADGLELSEYLIRHLGKKKIILVGTSWGSVLGVKMALARPDLFYAYIGHSQLTNFLANLQDAYAQVYKMAKSAEDKESVDKLETLGPPPYTDVQSPGQVLRIIKKYERNNSLPAPKWTMAPEYDNEVDENDRYNGDDYSWLYFIGHNGFGIEGMNHTPNF